MVLVQEWNDKKVGDGIVIEEDGRKIRLIKKHAWRNVISRKGYSKGVHSWIFEFGDGKCGCTYTGYDCMIVCFGNCPWPPEFEYSENHGSPRNFLTLS